MTIRPELTVTSVTIGAADPVGLADFYARLLGTEVRKSEPGWAQLAAPGGPTLNFEHERVYEPPVWPSEEGAQQTMEHLDIWVKGDLGAAVAWAVECGAKLAEHQPQSDVRVLFDPAGHPFCLFT